MRKRVPNHLLGRLSEFVQDQIGLFYPKERWLELLKAIKEASAEFGFDDVESCINWLLSSPLRKNQIEILAKKLTVGETYFLREKKTIEALETKVLPFLIKSRSKTNKSLKIWSAGCCTGEEPYTIAILLTQLIPDIENWDINIYGTDINPEFLQKASVGIYRSWSFRNTPYWLKEKYFNTVENSLFEIKPYIKKFVKFSYLNLAEDIYPSYNNCFHDIDLIFCRNVLMYFQLKMTKKIGNKFFETLNNDGWFIVGASETSHILFPEFISVTFPGAILYRKDRNNIFKDDDVQIYDPKQLKFSYIEKEEKNKIPTLPSMEFLNIKIEEKITEKIKEEKEFNSDEIDEDSENGFYAEALNFYRISEYQLAIDMLRDSFSDKQMKSQEIILISRSYANLGNIDKALIWCEKAIAIDKLNPGYYYFHGVILQEKGKFMAARTSLKRAIYLDSDFVIPHYMLGNINRQQGRIKESDKNYENVLSLLELFKRDDILPESEGMTAGRLKEVIIFVQNEMN